MKALVAGFGRFPGAPRNPSAEIVMALAKTRRPALADVALVPVVLPTEYNAVFETLPALLRAHDPDIVLFFGLAGRTPWFRVERRAVNRATLFFADATRRKHATRALVPGSDPALPARTDTIRLRAAARAAGADARLSRDAGRYICNAAFYRALLAARENGRPRLVAFIHIPHPRRRAPARNTRRTTRLPTGQTVLRAGAAALAELIAQARRKRG